MWNGEWERRECLWAGSQTPALPEPLGLGDLPRQVLALRATGKGLAGHEASST